MHILQYMCIAIYYIVDVGHRREKVLLMGTPIITKKKLPDSQGNTFPFFREAHNCFPVVQLVREDP